jgi:tRNA (guanine-N7-)-methyltransferase
MDPQPLDPGEIALSPEKLRELDVAALGRVSLEIGFGGGELLIAQAEQDPGTVFLGVEISRKRVFKAARRAARLGLANVRLVNAPAQYLLERVLPAASIAECWINCPDPWPKRRHSHRRLFQKALLEQLARVLQPGARLHACTDDHDYARWIHALIAAEAALENLCAPAPWSPQPPERPATAYEAEWLAEGRSLVYFEYRRRPQGCP